MTNLPLIYTPAMSESKIKTAADGVDEVGMMDARAALTELVREVRYGGKVGALTERKVRQVMLVTPDTYETAKRNEAIVAALQAADPKLYARLLANVD